jgi:hypothetical protein
MSNNFLLNLPFMKIKVELIKDDILQFLGEPQGEFMTVKKMKA